MYCNFSHQEMEFFCDLILDLAIELSLSNVTWQIRCKQRLEKYIAVGLISGAGSLFCHPVNKPRLPCWMMNNIWQSHPVTPADTKTSTRHVSELPSPAPPSTHKPTSLPTSRQLSEATLNHPSST